MRDGKARKQILGDVTNCELLSVPGLGDTFKMASLRDRATAKNTNLQRSFLFNCHVSLVVLTQRRLANMFEQALSLHARKINWLFRLPVWPGINFQR